MNRISNDSIHRAMTYKEYRDLVAELLAQGKATGDTQTEAYVSYSKLGNARMKRLNKTFTLSQEAQQVIHKSAKKHKWIVLTEGWCGDAGHALPIINKIAEASKNIDLKIVLRDENDDLMNQFLTNGSRSIPKLIAVDNESDEVVHTWGPRPSKAAKMVDAYKQEKGSLDDEFKEELQVWYNNDKGENIEKDLLQLL